MLACRELRSQHVVRKTQSVAAGCQISKSILIQIPSVEFALLSGPHMTSEIKKFEAFNFTTHPRRLETERNVFLPYCNYIK